MVVMAIAELVLLGLVNGFGSDATAAYGAVNQIMGYAQFPAISISISVSIFGAQAIGGGNPGRLDAIVRTGLADQPRPDRRAGGARSICSPRAVLGIFITDSAVLELAQELLHIALWSSVPFGMATVFSGRDARRRRGLGCRMLLSIFAIVAIEVPAAVILSRTIGLEGRLGRLSDRVLRHVRAADGLLRAGMAQAHDRTLDLTSAVQHVTI